MSIKVSGGGGGGGGYPGVTSNGTGGLTAPGDQSFGNQTAATVPSFIQLNGAVTIQDSPGNLVDGDNPVFISQHQPVPIGGNGYEAVFIKRQGNTSDADYQSPAVTIQDTSGSAQHVLQIKKGATLLLDLGVQPSIAGALSSVTDANAKAVLTSLIAALTGTAIATDGTT